METRDDVLIRGLWYRHTNTIIDVKIGNTDTDTYRFEPMLALMDWWEKTKKDKYGKKCHDQRKCFFRSFFL